MTPRDVVKKAIEFDNPPYVPWQLSFTVEAAEKLRRHYGADELDGVLGNHFLGLGSGIGFFEELPDDRFRDIFGVVWNRSQDKDIGIVEGEVLPEPDLAPLKLPDINTAIPFGEIEGRIAAAPDRFRVFNLGFSLFERAWTLRGMENLLMDLCLNPEFADSLFGAIADWNIEVMKKAVAYDIDCIHFGDDWGQQHGLIMGYPFWKRFLYPHLKRMYEVGRAHGMYVSIHSCGDVDELFPDLTGIGLNLFNPFQPEVMDVFSLMKQYRGKLAFYGGLSTQRTLPYGTAEEVRSASRALIEAGKTGGLVFSPAHAVEGDVPLENMLAFIDVLKSQPGAPRS